MVTHDCRGEGNLKEPGPLPPTQVLIYSALFGVAYGLLYMLGNFTENDYLWALIWPANAFMLGMLIRFPMLSRPLGWGCCVAGFLLTIPIIGYGFGLSAALAIYNFGVVGTGYFLLSRFDKADQRLERPISIFYLLLSLTGASIFSGVVGTILIGPLFIDPKTVSSFRYWFSVELLNQLAFLPMILSFPSREQWRHRLKLVFHDFIPTIALISSAIVGVFFGGMGAVAFPVSILQWCAISYSVFATAVLTLAFCGWTIIATTFGYVDISGLTQSQILSISMGAALMTLGPLIIATTSAMRNDVTDQLRYLATEREIISDELEHRIKNLFALVNGLISLSTRDHPEMRPLASTLKNRLSALNSAHDMVRAGSKSRGAQGSSTSLQKLLKVLLHPYEGDHAANFAIDGDDPAIDSGIVTPLALIFHELATNATKYGSLSIEGGNLRISISHHDGNVLIAWTETHPDPTSIAHIGRSSYGSKLLDLTIKSQLGGTYSRDWHQGGMDILISLPGALFKQA